MSQISKRTAPKQVTPVVIGSIEYIAPYSEAGCVYAKSLKTGKIIWKNKSIK